MPRPPLWAVRSAEQVYLTEQSNHAIDSGPGVAFTHLIPDIDHYNGRSGRVFPLYCDRSARRPNVTPGLHEHLEGELGQPVTAADLFAYVAAVVAHSGYTQRFRRELEHPGVRVPLTTEPALWAEAMKVGHEILWLHTFGESRTDPALRRRRFSKFVEDNGPRVHGNISDRRGQLPDAIEYDPNTETLVIGTGRLHPVDRRVWEYDVGGMSILRHWFNYRSAHQRYRRRSSALDDETIEAWSTDLTDELLEILAVLQRCITLEQLQANLLERICTGPLLTVTALKAADVLPPLAFARLGQHDDDRPPALF